MPKSLSSDWYWDESNEGFETLEREGRRAEHAHYNITRPFYELDRALGEEVGLETLQF